MQGIGMDKQTTIEKMLENYIRQGRWGIHERLPSERELAEEFGASRNTIRFALRALSGRKVLSSRRGSGTFVVMIPEKQVQGDAAMLLLGLRLEGFRIVMPQVIAGYPAWMTPTKINKLESLLSQVGMALRSGDRNAFAQTQQHFFAQLVQHMDNAQLETALSHLLPAGKSFSKLLERQSLTRCEVLFSLLASILNALRHVEPALASQKTTEYASMLGEFFLDAKQYDTWRRKEACES